MRKIVQDKKQIVLFLCVGAMSVFAELLMMRVFTRFVPYFFYQETNFNGIQYPISNTLSTSFAILLNYWLSIKFVFKRGRHNKRREFLYFVMISSLVTFLSLGVFQIFINFIFINSISFVFFRVNPIFLSKIMAIGIVSIPSYFIKKNIIFNG